MTELCVERVSKAYGPRPVLREFSLTVRPGETVCIMGPSGCGKTTLLRLIAGLTVPDAGHITGVPARISPVFQEDRLCEDFSAEANIRLVTARRSALPHALLEELGLEDAARLPVRELSGGMRRRVAIARALACGGALFLLDEPFRELDGATRERVMACVARHTAGKTVLLVTHDPAEAEYFGGRQILL